VPKVLVFWALPQHLTPEEADAWMQEQLGAVGPAALYRLSPAHRRTCAPWDRMLELEERAAAGLGELLGDLRLLGMRPVAVRLEDAEEPPWPSR